MFVPQKWIELFPSNVHAIGTWYMKVDFISSKQESFCYTEKACWNVWDMGQVPKSVLLYEHTEVQLMRRFTMFLWTCCLYMVARRLLITFTVYGHLM